MAQQIRKFKVIVIFWTYASSKRAALEIVHDGDVEPDAEFAVEDKPKGWVANLIKQVLG